MQKYIRNYFRCKLDMNEIKNKQPLTNNKASDIFATLVI